MTTVENDRAGWRWVRVSDAMVDYLRDNSTPVVVRVVERDSREVEMICTRVPAPAAGWQPIDTAPPGLADGKWTYVLFSGYSKGRSFAGRVVVSGWMGKTHDGRYEPVHSYSYKLVITHWMPMPTDPDDPRSTRRAA